MPASATNNQQDLRLYALIARYLADPLSFPPEFKTWLVKYSEQHVQAGQLDGKLQLSKLADPGPGMVVGSSGNLAAAVFPPGHDYAVSEFVANVPVAATTEAGATTIVTAAAVVLDGATTVKITFSTPYLAKGTTFIRLYLFDGSTSQGFFGHEDTATGIPCTVQRRLTPSAGSHTYSVRASVDAGTGGAQGGNGGAGAYMPGYLWVTKA